MEEHYHALNFGELLAQLKVALRAWADQRVLQGLGRPESSELSVAADDPLDHLPVEQAFTIKLDKVLDSVSLFREASFRHRLLEHLLVHRAMTKDELLKIEHSCTEEANLVKDELILYANLLQVNMFNASSRKESATHRTRTGTADN